MKKIRMGFICALLLVSGQWARAYQPGGWLWFSWPYAYNLDASQWVYFNETDTQWCAGVSPASAWVRLPQTGLANGWSYWQWPYAYAGEESAWHYLNESDTQWCLALGEGGSWSRFGAAAMPNSPTGMVLIPGGSNSGTNPPLGAGESYDPGWYPQTYSLTVSSFYMDRTEVTKAQWDDVYAWAITHGYSFDNAGSGKAANHPVHTVNWYDVVKWCNARSEKAGSPVSYRVGGDAYRSGRQAGVACDLNVAGYRLPTDVEWEYAGRGGAVGRRFPWSDTDMIQHSRANYYSAAGYSYDTSATRGDHPTYNDGVYPYTSPAGSFAPNGYGLYDMAGNVWEWCFDWHPGAVASARVLRGGDWSRYAGGCRVGIRGGNGAPDYADSGIGFRVVLPPGQ